MPGINWIIKKLFSYESDLLHTEIGGLKFKNKVGLAAGFDKNADFYQAFGTFGFAFIEIGTVTPLAQYGNAKPRLFRIKKDRAMINRMGFNNKGVDYAVRRLRKRNDTLVIGGNIGKNTDTSYEDAILDYAVCFEKLYDHVDYFTVNVSCPNVKGMEKLQDYKAIDNILHKIMEIRAEKAEIKPVFLKISPDLTFDQIDEMLHLYYHAGLDGIIATNTTTKRNNLSIHKKEIERIGNGGLSGMPVADRVKEIVGYICKQSSGKIPVIAVGGIMSPEDAEELIRTGASLVQLYTGFIYEGPFLVKQINRHLDQILKER